MELIKEQAESILGKREWWKVGENTAIVIYGKEACGVVIQSVNKKDITNLVSEKLRDQKNIVVKLIPSIDSQMIECPIAEIKGFLEDLENLM